MFINIELSSPKGTSKQLPLQQFVYKYNAIIMHKFSVNCTMCD